MPWVPAWTCPAPPTAPRCRPSEANPTRKTYCTSRSPTRRPPTNCVFTWTCWLAQCTAVVRPPRSTSARWAPSWVASLRTRLTDREPWSTPSASPDMWWSVETKRKYEMRERCFLGQLTRHVNDSTTGKLLRRVVSVSSGLRLAFFAHKAHELESGKHETLRDMTAMSGDQLLFASFCYTHCHSVGKLGEVLDLRFGRHTLGELLCNVAVTNMLEFSEAFGCADDAKMSAAVKCRIW
ncbi:hypothetical protein MRX96_034115 [Rhipicephalus microplus]